MDSAQWVPFIDKIEFKRLCTDLGIDTFKTLGVYSTVNELMDDINTFPSSFIIKYSSESGLNLIVKDKRTWSEDAIRRKITRFGPRIESALLNERQYRHVTGRYLVEELIVPVPVDYKLFITDGRVKLIWVDSDRFRSHKRTVYRVHEDYTATRWSDCRWGYDHDPNAMSHLPQPMVKQLCDAALRIAHSVPIDMVRIDLYYLNDRVYGGEVTLTSGGFKEPISSACARFAAT